MAKLIEVELSKLDPNPFRDGSGGTPPATWASVRETYGFNETKLEELKQSYLINGVWAGVHIRPYGDHFQLAFGHHRIEAARRLGLKKLPVILDNLSNDQMVQFMAAENSEEYGHDFALGVLNAVEAVVRAYGAGQITLEAPEPSGYGRFGGRRAAPSFQVDEVSKSVTHPYTAQTIAKYLGWTVQRTDRDGVAADKKTMAALAALELIELGALKRSALKGLGTSQARELILVTRRAMEAARTEMEAQEKAFKDRLQKAAGEGDRNLINKLNTKMEELVQEAPKALVEAGRRAASTVVEFHRDSKSFAEAARKASEALDLKAAAPKVAKKEPRLDLSGVDDLVDKIDRLLLESDSKWENILELAKVKASKKTFGKLEASLLRLAERARSRARELKRVIE